MGTTDLSCLPINVTTRLQWSAAIIDLRYEELWLALYDGQTVATVAIGQGRTAAFMREHLIERETQALTDAVSAQCLTAEFAAERIATLPASVDIFLHDETPPWFITCRRAFHDRYLTAAQLLDLDEMVLRDQLAQGQALVDIAAEKHFTRQRLFDALVDAEITYIHEWAGSDCIAEADAVLWIQIVPTLIDQFLEDDATAAAAIRERNAMLQPFMFIPLLMN